jgi:hypothetical protein
MLQKFVPMASLVCLSPKKQFSRYGYASTPAFGRAV